MLRNIFVDLYLQIEKTFFFLYISLNVKLYTYFAFNHDDILTKANNKIHFNQK